jgi:cytochrome c oxidase subunit 4
MSSGHGHSHVDPVRDYVLNFVALVALLGVTVGVAYIDLPIKSLNIIVAMAIACIKAVLVIAIFMGMRKTTKLTQVWAYGGLIFFLTLIAISLSDYFSRH